MLYAQHVLEMKSPLIRANLFWESNDYYLGLFVEELETWFTHTFDFSGASECEHAEEDRLLSRLGWK